MLALIFSLVEEAVKITPGLVTAFEEIFSKPNPTPEDWAALRAKVLAENYADYVPASDLPAAGASQSAPPPPPVTDPVPPEPTPAPETTADGSFAAVQPHAPGTGL